MCWLNWGSQVKNYYALLIACDEYFNWCLWCVWGIIFTLRRTKISLWLTVVNSYYLELWSSLFVYCCRMKGVRDWVFSQILSKSLVSPSPLSGSNSLYAGEHRNENFNEQGTILTLLFDFEWNHWKCAEITSHKRRS